MVNLNKVRYCCIFNIHSFSQYLLVVDLHWISTYEFVAIYCQQEPPDPNGLPPLCSLVVIVTSVSTYHFLDIIAISFFRKTKLLLLLILMMSILVLDLMLIILTFVAFNLGIVTIGYLCFQ